MSDHVHVIGSTGRSGAALCRALLAGGRTVVPIARRAVDGARLADLTNPVALRAALSDARIVVSTAHARFTRAVLAAAPRDATLVLIGSTRKYSRWPDAHGLGVVAGEIAFLSSGRRGVMLHPTMIFGADGEDNVHRLAQVLQRLQRLPVVPLPGAGENLVQPIHQDDLTRSLLAAVDRHWERGETLVVAGPQAVTYADLVRAVAAATGLPPPRVISLPAPALIAAARVAALFPGLPRIGTDEIRRLLEDKSFRVGRMREQLGVEPIGLEEGLARTFTTAVA